MGLLFFHLHQFEDQPFKIETFSYLTLLLIPLLAYLIKHVIKQPRLKLPPGPLGLPMIGNMHQIGNSPHHSLALLSKKYGPLMYLRLGRVPTFVVSSADMAKEFMKTHDLTFCSKSSHITLRKFSYGCLEMAFAPYSEEWSQIRKISTIELFTTKRVQYFRPMREEEVAILVRTISKYSSSSSAVNLSDLTFCLVNNIICQQVFGKRVSEEGECGRSKFHELISNMSALFATFCSGDFIPYMEWLNVLTGLKSRIGKYFCEMDAFFEETLEECRHDQLIKFKRNDFVSVLLQHQKNSTFGFPLTNDHIKAILMDLFFAGTDTTATSIEWGMTELMRNPRVMKKAQNEVRGIIGKKQKVEESDLKNLEYLKLVVKEILRFHPPAPLLIPRLSAEECRINNYNLPKNAKIFINVWEIARDPKFWENPNEFIPERFKDSPIDYKGQYFQFLPFGAGRRICPAITSGVTTIELVLANLLHIFDWDFPKEMTKEDLDVSENFGVVASKKTPLLLLATIKN